MTSAESDLLGDNNLVLRAMRSPYTRDTKTNGTVPFGFYLRKCCLLQIEIGTKRTAPPFYSDMHILPYPPSNFWAATNHICTSAVATSRTMMTSQEIFSTNKRQDCVRKATCNVTSKLLTEFQPVLAFARYNSLSKCTCSVWMTEDSQEHLLAKFVLQTMIVMSDDPKFLSYESM